ncbi:tetratricopeptide repeat protein [Plectonema cf. radiosum LEGE 06105]|uniref:Tetratricopeptide repeat protein n=1 Tax=Plectonema cf. radiosum LEGE 06105 TaxID=945769 RepID=A0A8J7JWT7_9CYAN|nr:tetratricopeptide repeat protein [Plectonema radiosum]MBE9217184.1 tetratricopeptide repeat protein [Plectonema cf. radiosum LEGE 06105]
MSQGRNRWFVKIVLIVAVIALVGGSMVPIIAAFNDSQQSGNATNSTGNSDQDQKSKLEDAVRGYEQVLLREPENQTALIGLLENRLQLLRLGQGDIKGVITPLEKLSKLNPEETRYAVLLAQAKQQTGDKEGAAQAYRTVLETKPGDLSALQGMVALLLEEKRPEAAIGLLQESLDKAQKANKIEPGSVDTAAVEVLLGNIYAKEKQYAQALSTYDKIIKNDPKDFRPVLAKAMVLKDQGKTEEAQPLFNQAASLAPAQYKDEINRQATSTTPTPTPSASPSPKSE